MRRDQVAKKNKNKNNTDALLLDCKSSSYQSEGTLNYRIYVTFIIAMTLSCFCSIEYIISFYFASAIICISFATFVFKLCSHFVLCLCMPCQKIWDRTKLTYYSNYVHNKSVLSWTNQRRVYSKMTF